MLDRHKTQHKMFQAARSRVVAQKMATHVRFHALALVGSCWVCRQNEPTLHPAIHWPERSLFAEKL
jgi:hypothetical protein